MSEYLCIVFWLQGPISGGRPLHRRHLTIVTADTVAQPEKVFVFVFVEIYRMYLYLYLCLYFCCPINGDRDVTIWQLWQLQQTPLINLTITNRYIAWSILVWEKFYKKFPKDIKTFVTISLSNLKLGLPNMLELFWQMDPFPSFNQYWINNLVEPHVGLFEEDNKDIDVLQVVLEHLHHVLNMPKSICNVLS